MHAYYDDHAVRGGLRLDTACNMNAAAATSTATHIQHIYTYTTSNIEYSDSCYSTATTVNENYGCTNVRGFFFM